MRSIATYGLAGLVLLGLAGTGMLGLKSARAQAVPPDTYTLDARGLSLSEALSRAADVAGIDLAYAPELVVGKTSSCFIRGASAVALLDCVLSGTGLGARQLPGGAFLLERKRVVSSGPAGVPATGAIRGRVRADSTFEEIAGAHVFVRGTLLGDATGSDGAYLIRQVPAGQYLLVASSLGFSTAYRGQVAVPAGDTVEVFFELAEQPVYLGELTVVARYDRLTQQVARQLPIALQSVQVLGLGLGLLVSANPGTVTRFQLSGLGNLAGENVSGLQVSGGVNYTGGRVNGLQVGALGNQAAAYVQGMQAAGVFNGTQGDLRGVQFSGATNVVWGAVAGVQGAGIVNAGGKLSGVQAAGALNLGGRVSGAQVSGLVNVSTRHVEGLQAAGAVNVAASVHGMQVAGLVNVAKVVHGMQIGVVNVADESTGWPLGLFNYVRNVGLALDVGLDEAGLVTTAIRSGNHHASTFLGVGVLPWAGTDAPRWAPAFGLGAEVALPNRFFTTFDGWYYLLNPLDGADDHLGKLRLLLGYRPFGRLAVLAGPTYSTFFGNGSDGHGLAPWTHRSGRVGSTAYRSWFGFYSGLRFSL